MLRVLVNARPLVPGKIGGLEAAFRNTLERLLGRDDLGFTLVTTYHNHDSFGGWQGRVRLLRVDEDQMPHGLEVAQAGHDVLWCPFLFLEPDRPAIPGVTLIPDLQHEAFPEFFSNELLTMRLKRMRTTVAWSKRVLTISGFSKQHLCATYHLPEAHVVVTPLDCGEEFRGQRDPARVAALRREHGLPDRYALFPANAWPHKNHRGLLRGLARLRERFGIALPVVLTGAQIGSVDVAAEATAAGVRELVHALGFVAKADMPHLYDGAALLAFVTLFEGFGIPVAEAMRRGVPIVAANRTSIPELAEGCALLVDPEDPDAIAAALHATLTDAEGTRARVARGLERIAGYSYAVAAERTLAALQAAAAEPAQLVAAVARDARPSVFVVTPSFNQGRFLRATIESVLGQDYPNLQYFVADGGSSDESVEILRSYGDRVRWSSGPDGGQAAAIAAAWAGSDAEIVAWLNSDDTFLPGAVSAGVAHLLAHPEHAMVYGRAWYTDVDGRTTAPYPTKPFDRALLAGECFICQPATFVRREVFRVIDLPDPKLRFAMDYDLWIRLSARFEVGFVDAWLATSRMYEQNKTLGERDGVYREILQVVQRHFGQVPHSWTLGYALYRCRRVIDKFFWFLPARVQRFVFSRLIGHDQRKTAAPPYADGWAGSRTRIVVQPDPEGMVVIEGESPFWPYRAPLEIRVCWEQRQIEVVRIERRGPFRIECRLPGRRIVPVVLELEASRTFVPAVFGANDDQRPLSFRLAGAAAPAPAHPTGVSA